MIDYTHNEPFIQRNSDGSFSTIDILICIIGIAWAVIQLLTASLILVDSVILRSFHISFALSLGYLIFPFYNTRQKKLKNVINTHWANIIPALVVPVLALYFAIEYESIAQRIGTSNSIDIVVGVCLILCMLEAARRALGPALPCIAIAFILYSFFAPYMPTVLASKAASVSRLISQLTLSTEGIYGVPLYISASVIFYFVLFGAFLEVMGAGKYFVELAFSLFGKFRGGPAKAAIVASGLTGMISGSSVANTVTTGTFTIPLMKKNGYPAYKAAAIEVACSTNGQLMPPIMGAAAFIIAEYCALPYFEVIKAAFIPAVISYIALIYIVHIEAVKLGIPKISKHELLRFSKIFVKGIHFFIPIAILIVLLVVQRTTPTFAATFSIFSCMIMMVCHSVFDHLKKHRKQQNLFVIFRMSLYQAFVRILKSLAIGSRNMVSVGLAVGTAGIIVGIVNLGFGNNITQLVETISNGNFYIILLLTAVASLLLGMGLPTTANYIVMATIVAPIIVTLGAKYDMAIPLIAAHLFVFFFGILADDTPPVGLAAYAAAAIAKSPPIKTGVQGFLYDIRTAILPFMFIFNSDLLLINVTQIWRVIMIFIIALMGMISFASLTQGFMFVKSKWYDYILFASVCIISLRPYLISRVFGIHYYGVIFIGLAIFAGIILQQYRRSLQNKSSVVNAPAAT